MILTISGYTFSGPYEQLADISNQSGLYAIMCIMRDGYLMLDVDECTSMRDAIVSHPAVLNPALVRRYKGRLAVAVYPTPNLDRTGRVAIKNEVRKECLPIMSYN